MNTLTELEMRILALVQRGLTNSQIAVVGKMHPTTIARGLRSIKRKLHVATKQELKKMQEEAQP